MDIAQPYRLRERRRTFRLCFERPRERLPREAACLVSDRAPARSEPRSFREDDDRAFSFSQGRPASFALADGRLDIHVRSIDGILHYLGEIVAVQHRDADQGGYRPAIDLGAGAEPLFLVEVRDGAGSAVHDAFLTAVHDGRVFSIPDGAETSAEVLALVSQLLAQSRSVQDLPPTGTVTIIGD